MTGDLERFLAEVEIESRKAGVAAQTDLEHYRRHFEMARRVLELRQERGWTQVQLSRASGVQQSEISRIERGQGNPTFQTLAQIAGALGMRVAFLPMIKKRRVRSKDARMAKARPSVARRGRNTQ